MHMKKFLLSLAAATAVFSASADMIVDAQVDFADYTKFPFFVMGYEPTIDNGILKAEYPGEWYQFFVMDGLNFSEGKEYTITAKIKASKAGELNVQLGNWGNILENKLYFTTEWTEASVKLGSPAVSSGFSVFQPGTFDGSLEIEWVRLSHEGIPVAIPETGDIIAEYYTPGSDKTLSGWGGSAKFENVTEDGKPCLKFTNETAAEGAWAVQMSVNGEFNAGTTYYLGFDIKGDAAKNIEVNFQSNGEENGTAYYEGKGALTKFNITPEWTRVIVYGECAAGSNPDHIANCILFNLGKYAGTFFMTNVKLYTESMTGVSAPSADTPSHWTVYNLQGIKVLETDNKADLSGLRPGLYIVNGKKTAILNR